MSQVRSCCSCLAYAPGAVLAIVAVLWPTPSTAACSDPVTVRVFPEEFVHPGSSLAELQEQLVLAGRRTAIREVATERLGTVESLIEEDGAVTYTSATRGRFTGHVTGHRVVDTDSGRLGELLTLRVTMDVDVCITAQDHTLFVRLGQFRTDDGRVLERMPAQLAWLNNQRDGIGFLAPDESPGVPARWTMDGEVVDVAVNARDWDNRQAIESWRACERDRRRSANATTGNRDLDLFLSVLTQPADCGPGPQRVRGRDLTAQATFQIRVCDADFGDCRVFRQRYEEAWPDVGDRRWSNLAPAFWRDGFGFVATVAVNTLEPAE